MSSDSRKNRQRDRHAALEALALQDLEELRGPLFRELEKLLRKQSYLRGEPPHLCCRRDKNQMRISPLEARAIADAFRNVFWLRSKLPAVLRRLEAELPRLRDDEERQGFDCPLLEGTRCLVHRVAKPIGCLAWHPGREYSDLAMRAFEARDRLNDRVYGRGWKLRVIPLWLKRVLARRLERAAKRRASPPKARLAPGSASDEPRGGTGRGTKKP
jgi:hypothetical protein